MGEWVTSCGVSCVCKLDGIENVGRVEQRGNDLQISLFLFDARSFVAVHAVVCSFVCKMNARRGQQWDLPSNFQREC